MPDTTVWIALITGGSTLAAGTVAPFLVEHFRGRADERKRQWDRAEGERERRKIAYQELLDAAIRFHQDGAGTQPFTLEEVQRWFLDFEHRLNAVLILGAQAAADAAQAVADVIGESMDLAGAPRPPGGRSRPGWEAVEERFLAAWAGFLKAAREDVGPVAPPVGHDRRTGPLSRSPARPGRRLAVPPAGPLRVNRGSTGRTVPSGTQLFARNEKPLQILTTPHQPVLTAREPES